jgi:hypothetical protein
MARAGHHGLTHTRARTEGPAGHTAVTRSRGEALLPMPLRLARTVRVQVDYLLVTHSIVIDDLWRS